MQWKQSADQLRGWTKSRFKQLPYFKDEIQFIQLVPFRKEDNVP